jgi:metal-responsive CopG/Arc/MetJ family transcriptional regulator
MRIVTVRLPEELLELLDWYAIKHNTSRSEAIREAIKRLLEKEDLNAKEE